VARTLDSTPAADGFRMPAEFEPHDGCWMLWPVRPDVWRMGGKPAQEAFAAVSAAIAEAEPVTMGVGADQFEHARAVLPPEVRVVELSSNDAWMRDVGPTFVVDAGGARRGVDWRFNAWGGLYFPWHLDDGVARKVLEVEGADRYRAPFILEGGAIHVDGEGTCLTTEECLLNRNRNPHLRREEIERGLRHHLGVEKVVWLGRGVHVDETDGHVDNLCAFVRPGVVVLTWTDDERDPQHAISLDARRRLEAATDARGRPFEVHLLHQPGPLYITEEEARGVDAIEGSRPRLAGDRMAGSYVNFYIANDRVILPLLDERHDDAAAQTLAGLFPERRIVGVPGREILQGGGNVHCITQQVPRAGTLPYSEPSPTGA
jgi:agmatine deiminase